MLDEAGFGSDPETLDPARSAVKILHQNPLAKAVDISGWDTGCSILWHNSEVHWCQTVYTAITITAIRNFIHKGMFSQECWSGQHSVKDE